MPKEISVPALDLTGKTAIVAGNAKGLWFGIAATYAYYGANVVITARTAADVKAASLEINKKYVKGPSTCFGVTADLSRQEDIDNVISRAIHMFGKIDILVNDAGISEKTAKVLSDECNAINFDLVVATRQKGVFLLSKAAARQMVAQGTGGSIINVASLGALFGGKNFITYGVAKAGLKSLTKTMANEFTRYNITVNAICTGYAVTPLNENIFANEDNKKKLALKTPVRQLRKIERDAGPALALASDCFGHMTRTYILLYGRQLIRG